MRKGARERGGRGNRERGRGEREREGGEVTHIIVHTCTCMYVYVHETYQCTVQLYTEMRIIA